MKRITAFVLTIILTFCFTGCSENKKIKSEAKGNVWITEGTAENDITQKNFDSVAESDDLELLINPNTTDIAVMVKKQATFGLPTDTHLKRKAIILFFRFRMKTPQGMPTVWIRH